MRVSPRPSNQPVEEILRDVHQHQTREDLVGSEPVAEQRGDRGPRHAAEHAHQHHERKREGRCDVRRQDRNGAARDSARRELALGADVPEVRPEADRETGADQHQRGGLHDELLDRPQGRHRLDEVDVERMQRIEPARGENDAAHQDRECDGDHGRGRGHHRTRLRALLELQPHAAAPPPSLQASTAPASWPTVSGAPLAGTWGYCRPASDPPVAGAR